MEQITLRLPETMIGELEEEADEKGVSRSEHIRDVIDSRRDTDELRERIKSRENRIKELEEQLSRRSEIEEKVDLLANRVDEKQEPEAPWPVQWYRWWRSE